MRLTPRALGALGHLGPTSKVYGMYTFALSPYEQKAFKGFGKGLVNVSFELLQSIMRNYLHFADGQPLPARSLVLVRTAVDARLWRVPLGQSGE